MISVYGTIISDWSGTPNGPFSLKVTIPANTMAKVFLPMVGKTHVTQDGHPVHVQKQSDSYVIQVGSGAYEFEVK